MHKYNILYISGDTGCPTAELHQLLYSTTCRRGAETVREIFEKLFRFLFQLRDGVPPSPKCAKPIEKEEEEQEKEGEER